MAAMKELWIGVVEVLTEESSAGNTRAFTNVVTWASSTEDYSNTVTSVLSKYGWSVLGIENSRPTDNESDYDEEIVDIIDRARANPNACIFGTCYYYPSKPS
jgi:hypothetical protein